MYLLTGKLYCGECKSPMVGVSGTGQHGELHYYYTCKNHRANKLACPKKQVTRDFAEEQVAIKLKQLISRQEVIEWLADSVLAYLKEHQETDEIIMLKERLSTIRKEKDNTLKAIRQGVIHPSVLEMLEQLSTEESSIAAKLAIAQDRIKNDLTRGHVIAWVESFKDGDVKDKNYQERLFDAFLVRAFLYDDHIRIVFNYTGKGTEEVDVPFDIDMVEENYSETIEITDSGEMVAGSYKGSQAPPLFLKRTLHLRNGVYVKRNLDGVVSVFCVHENDLDVILIDVNRSEEHIEKHLLESFVFDLSLPEQLESGLVFVP